MSFYLVILSTFSIVSSVACDQRSYWCCRFSFCIILLISLFYKIYWCSLYPLVAIVLFLFSFSISVMKTTFSIITLWSEYIFFISPFFFSFFFFLYLKCCIFFILIDVHSFYGCKIFFVCYHIVNSWFIFPLLSCP